MEVISTNKERIYTLQFRGELDHHNAKEAIRKMELKLGAALPKQLLLDFAEACAGTASMEKNPKLDGRFMAMFLSPKNSK